MSRCFPSAVEVIEVVQLKPNSTVWRSIDVLIVGICATRKHAVSHGCHLQNVFWMFCHFPHLLSKSQEEARAVSSECCFRKRIVSEDNDTQVGIIKLQVAYWMIGENSVTIWIISVSIYMIRRGVIWFFF